jgi:hypothetical protein
MVSGIPFIDMDIEFFEKLSKKQADAYLQTFLDTESSKINKTVKQCTAAGLRMDYSLKLISPFMRWVLKRLTAIPEEPDPTIPEWIRNTASYTSRLFEFNGPSEELILQAAYYFGESFVRSRSSLYWGTGDIKTYEANMPVVIGFQHELELAPILIAENLLRRVTAEPKKIGDFQTAVESWSRDV